MTELEMPKKKGWYWVLFDGYDEPTPCWLMLGDYPGGGCFLPAGLGDSSSSGVFMDDINKVGPEIIVPTF